LRKLAYPPDPVLCSNLILNVIRHRPRLMVLAEEVLESCRYGDDEERRGPLASDVPGVRDAAWEEDEGSRASLEYVLAAADGDRPFHHIEALIFPAVDVQRSPASGARLDQLQAPTGRGASRLDAGPGAGDA